ncbi:MAG: GNAT family N-acetyltransferase [Rhizobiaceae bacterium]
MSLSGLRSCPSIETERLLLRAHRLDDFEAYAAMWADETVTRYIGGQPFSREMSWTRFLRYAGHWPVMGFGFWAIEEKGTRGFIGEAGFHELRRELEPAIEGTPEIGWTLVPDVHGRGYASEALSALIEWGERRLARQDFVCLIDHGNLASIRLAQKFGFRREVDTAYHDTPLGIYRRPARRE